jgi:rhamnosyltransferase subunit B
VIDDRRGQTQALLLPLGTLGDVLPFIALGRALSRRGDEVIVACNPRFAPLVERAGLSHEPLGDEAQYRALVESPRFFHRTRAFPHLMEHVGLQLAPTFAAIARHPTATVLAHPLALGAATAEELLGTRVVTVHLSPALLRSAWAADRLLADPFIAPAVNAFRIGLGLPSVTRVLRHGWRSRLHLALFPEWFAARQPDWPAALRYAGFALHDDDGQWPRDALARVVDEAEDSPIVVTAGTGHRFGGALFRAVVDAGELLGRRVVILTRFVDQLPHPLPSHVRHVEYLPLSRILPHAAALVHHGGIGTAAAALAHAVPQVVASYAHDQPDNATRLHRLGVAIPIEPARLSAARLAAALDELITSPDVERRCGILSQRIAAARPLDDAVARLAHELQVGELEFVGAVA